MEFTQSLLPRLLSARIQKVPDSLVGDKVNRLQTLAPRINELLAHPAIRWHPSCAFEVYEPSGDRANGECHDFVIFSGTLADEDGRQESWGLCLHHKKCPDFPALSLYLLPTPTMFHLTQFRTFINEVLRCFSSPTHMSFVRLEKLKTNDWKVASMKYSNGTDSLVPKQFYRMILAV